VPRLCRYATRELPRIPRRTEYPRRGERKIIARMFKPVGTGPSARPIDLRSGASNNGVLTDPTGLRREYLAEGGVALATLDFKTPARRARRGGPNGRSA